MDAIDGCVVQCAGGPEASRAGVKLIDFKPFSAFFIAISLVSIRNFELILLSSSPPPDPVDKRTEATYIEESSGLVKRVTKGMTGIIIESESLLSRSRDSSLFLFPRR